MQLLRFFVKSSFRTLALVIALFRSLPKTHDQLTIGENGDKTCFENWELRLFRQFSFYDNRIVQSSQYCTSLAYSDIQFFVLSSVTRKWNPKIIELLYLFPFRSLTCNTLWSGFLERRSTQFWPCLFSFRQCSVHLQSYLMRAGTQILWKKVEPNHQRIADDWFCNFQSWHTHQLGCICPSNSCIQWKREVTIRTLAVVQRPHGTALIASHLPEHKPPVGSRMT